MLLCKWALLVLVLCLSATAARASETGSEVIEAYGAPASVLNMDPCAVFDYAPMNVGSEPSTGHVIGQLRLANPDVMRNNKPNEGCESPSTLQLKTQSGIFDVEMGEYAYEANGIVLYEVSRHDNEIWGRGRAGKISFWVKLAVDELHTYESLATLPADMSVICTEPDKCAAASPDFLRDLKAATGHVQSCYEEPYTIASIIEASGHNYYELKLQDMAEGVGPFLHLPPTIYIPTRNAQGAQTGHFYSRGC